MLSVGLTPDPYSLKSWLPWQPHSSSGLPGTMKLLKDLLVFLSLNNHLLPSFLLFFFFELINDQKEKMYTEFLKSRLIFGCLTHLLMTQIMIYIK